MGELIITPNEYFFKFNDRVIVTVLLPTGEDIMIRKSLEQTQIALIDYNILNNILDRINGYSEKDFKKFKRDFRNKKKVKINN